MQRALAHFDEHSAAGVGNVDEGVAGAPVPGASLAASLAAIAAALHATDVAAAVVDSAAHDGADLVGVKGLEDPP